jgi:hypothetical protein
MATPARLAMGMTQQVLKPLISGRNFDRDGRMEE